MKYQELYQYFHQKRLFSLNEIRLIEPNFLHKVNISNRIKAGYIKQITKWRYIFCDIPLDETTLATIATTVYSPSYISMETGLRYYDLIPEWVFMETCISTKKTQILKTSLGYFKYQQVNPKLFWWYKLVKNTRWGVYKIAEPEKLICDFFYLKTQYKTDEDFAWLRIEKRQRDEVINEEKLLHYASLFKQKRLLKTINNLLTFFKNND